LQFRVKNSVKLVCANFSSLKKLSKKSKIAKTNRKRTAIISHQKILIIAKQSNPLVQIIIALYYCIAHGLRNKYRKMSSMRLPPLVLRKWYRPVSTINNFHATKTMSDNTVELSFLHLRYH